MSEHIVTSCAELRDLGGQVSAMKTKVQNMDSIERRIGTMEKEISSMKATLEKVLDAAKDAKYFSRKSYMEKGGKRD